jgi:glucans biosynthesis protein C
LPQKTDRLYFMDAMRAVLMTLGIVVHTSQIFNPARTWVLYSTDTTPLAGWLVAAITEFRMPAFFVVSGFFCALSWHKYGRARFLQARVMRLGLPFLTTALTLNSLQGWLLWKSGWAHYTMAEYLSSGAWVSHLWFMVNLMIYHVLTYILLTSFTPNTRGVQGAIEHTLTYFRPWVWFPLLSMVSVGTMTAAHFLPASKPYLLGAIDFYSLLFYLPYFAVGALLHFCRDLLKQLLDVRPVISILWVVIGIALRGASEHWLQGLLASAAAIFFDALVNWSAIALCFHAFARLITTDRTWARVISDSSYTVYLLHHLLVVALGLLAIEVGMGGTAGLVSIIGIVLVTTLLTHRYLIAPFGITRLLFNGHRERRRAPRQAKTA